MTEAEWLASNDARALALHIAPRLTTRKGRLCACGYARRLWHLLVDPRSKRAVEEAERYADDPTRTNQLRKVRVPADAASRKVEPVGLEMTPPYAAAVVALDTAGGDFRPHHFILSTYVSTISALTGLENSGRYGTAAAFCAEVVRCVVGNPFRLVPFDPRWRSADVVGVARGIYDDRAFDRLPLLADALMDAGCSDGQVIGHCRSEGPHVRGCWVVDMALGKE